MQVIYVSTAADGWTPAALLDLLHASRRNNLQAAVTGLLGHNERTFIQLLEGEPDDVRGVMARIQRDTRHQDVSMLLERRVASRYFPDWSMGFQETDQVIPGPGLSEFLPQSGTVLSWVAHPETALAFFEACRPAGSCQSVMPSRASS